MIQRLRLWPVAAAERLCRVSSELTSLLYAGDINTSGRVMTSKNMTSHITEICDMMANRDHAVVGASIIAASLIFFISIMINVTIVIVYAKTPSLRTISNR